MGLKTSLVASTTSLRLVNNYKVHNVIKNTKNSIENEVIDDI